MGKFKYTRSGGGGCGETQGVYSILTEVPVNRQRHPGRLSLQSRGFFAALQGLTSERALMDAQRVCLFWRIWEHHLSPLCSTSTIRPARIIPKNLVMISSIRGPWKLAQPSWPHRPGEVVLKRELWLSHLQVDKQLGEFRKRTRYACKHRFLHSAFMSQILRALMLLNCFLSADKNEPKVSHTTVDNKILNYEFINVKAQSSNF